MSSSLAPQRNIRTIRPTRWLTSFRDHPTTTVDWRTALSCFGPNSAAALDPNRRLSGDRESLMSRCSERGLTVLDVIRDNVPHVGEHQLIDGKIGRNNKLYRASGRAGCG